MWNNEEIYRKYSDFLKERYEAKVYKLPIHIPVSCPNRDGVISTKGCIFCGEDGSAHEFSGNRNNVVQQITIIKEKIKKKYNAQKFILYFQSFSSTYLSVEDAIAFYTSGIDSSIVAIYISTRPDCLPYELLEALKRVQEEKQIDIVIELGLQSVNRNTLKKINRGHGLAEFIHAVWQIKSFGFEICTHMILDLPWDTREDIEEGAKIISSLEIQQVKLHSLYVVENTELSKMIVEKQIELLSKEEYIERVAIFLSFLNPNIVLQRLIGRAPEKVANANWNQSWWKIQEEILQNMKVKGFFQGCKFQYLNGSANRKGGFIK